MEKKTHIETKAVHRKSCYSKIMQLEIAIQWKHIRTKNQKFMQEWPIMKLLNMVLLASQNPRLKWINK